MPKTKKMAKASVLTKLQIKEILECQKANIIDYLNQGATLSAISEITGIEYSQLLKFCKKNKIITKEYIDSLDAEVEYQKIEEEIEAQMHALPDPNEESNWLPKVSFEEAKKLWEPPKENKKVILKDDGGNWRSGTPPDPHFRYRVELIPLIYPNEYGPVLDEAPMSGDIEINRRVLEKIRTIAKFNNRTEGEILSEALERFF